ncbi:transcription initiation factor IIB [Pelomyxa schiedti]|nr:transcription initiation factor IIB [Pelomyxa schiedti]
MMTATPPVPGAPRPIMGPYGQPYQMGLGGGPKPQPPPGHYVGASPSVSVLPPTGAPPSYRPAAPSPPSFSSLSPPSYGAVSPAASSSSSSSLPQPPLSQHPLATHTPPPPPPVSSYPPASLQLPQGGGGFLPQHQYPLMPQPPPPQQPPYQQHPQGPPTNVVVGIPNPSPNPGAVSSAAVLPQNVQAYHGGGSSSHHGGQFYPMGVAQPMHQRGMNQNPIMNMNQNPAPPHVSNYPPQMASGTSTTTSTTSTSFSRTGSMGSHSNVTYDAPEEAPPTAEVPLPEFSQVHYRDEDENAPICTAPSRRGMKCEYEEDRKHGTVVCYYCGTVAREKIIDEGQEWRNFDDGHKDSSRITKDDQFISDLSTGVGAVYRSTFDKTAAASGDTAKGGQPSRRVMRQLESAEVKTKRAAFEKICTFADALGLPSRIVETAKELYSKFCAKKHCSRMFRTDQLVCAVLFSSCKRDNFPRTIKEIAKAAIVPEKDVKTAYSNLIKVVPELAEKKSVHAADLVERIGDKLKLEFQMKSYAMEIAKKAAPYVEGCRPASLAATAIFIACKNPPDNYKGNAGALTDKEIAGAADIAQATVSSMYRNLYPHLNEFVGTRS